MVDEDGDVLAVRKRSDLALAEDDAFLLVVEDELEPGRTDRLHHRAPDGVVGPVVDSFGAGALGVPSVCKAGRATGSGARGEDTGRDGQGFQESAHYRTWMWIGATW